MEYKKSLFLLMALFSLCFHARAQAVIKGFEYGEIMNIAEAYRQAPSLSFNLQFIYADSAHQDSIVEQINGSYKIQNGMSWTMIDSTEILQGSTYNVSVFHYDSVIAISNPQKYMNVLQLPFLDSLFRAQNIDSMNVTAVNDSTRSLKMYFNSVSLYSCYIIRYDLNTYMINSIAYFIKTPAYEDSSGSGISVMKINFSNYSRQVIDAAYFTEDRFIYKQGGQFFVKPAYTNFQLMVNTPN